MANGTLKRANPNTIQDKVLVGYQGWFTCGGDGEPIGPGHHGWLHWFNQPLPNGGRPNTDLWPDVSGYDASELYPAPGLTTPSGDPVHLFSSRHPKTVQRHFHWMALHGVDGAFLQRFAGQCEVKPGNIGIRDLRDEIGDRVREASEAEGRVYAIMYDVSGVSPDKIQNILEQDWIHLLRDKRLLDSPNYLHENNRPVVALWGFGLNGRNFTPELVRAIADFFRSSVPQGVYLVAGTPGHWRTSTSDADRNPEFVQVWTDCFDAISPWTVGRYGNEEEADRWGEERVRADADYLKKLEADGGRKVDYIPVVLPGGSGFNLSEGKWGMNDIRRNGGRFLWRQIYNAKRAGVRTIYGAMWDEYDEGTVFMPVVSYSPQLPVHPSFRFIALDVDGYDLPSDWYMRIAGYAAEAFHGERTLLDTFPVKELQDYWSTRPHYEAAQSEAHKKLDEVDEVTRAFREWEVSGGGVGVSDDAPPPYSLEDTTAQQGSPGPRFHHQQAVAGSGRAGGPPGSVDNHPSSGHSSLAVVAGAAAIPLAAAAVAHTMSSGSTSSPTPSKGTLSAAPPPVNLSSRPGEIVMAPPPPQHPQSPPFPPPPGAPPFQVAHDLGRQHSLPHGHGHVQPPEPGIGMPPSAHHSGHVPPIGHATHHSSNPVVGYPMPGYPISVEHARGRPRSRARSHSRSRSGSRSRRSSSGSRERHHSQMHSMYLPHQAHAHRNSHSHSPGPSHVGLGAHRPMYGRGRGFGFGSSPVGQQPQGVHPGGLHHAHSDSGVHGSYMPAHSHPIGHAPYGYGPGHAHAGQYQQGGYGYAQGAGPSPYPYPQEAMHGYTPHPSSQYYGTGAYGGSGSGRGGIASGITSALNAVEGIAGRHTREHLEKRVMSLTGRGSLFNKFK